MNPVTGLPTQDGGSVTVIAPSALLADWLRRRFSSAGRSWPGGAESAFSGVAVIITRPEPEKP